MSTPPIAIGVVVQVKQPQCFRNQCVVDVENLLKQAHEVVSVRHIINTESHAQHLKMFARLAYFREHKP